MTFLFLIILLLFLLLLPYLKFGWRVHRSISEQRKQWERAAKAQREREEQAYKRAHKKIDPEVGEYVSFTEIELSAEERAAQDNSSQYGFRAEEQISDVKWVDIND